MKKRVEMLLLNDTTWPYIIYPCIVGVLQQVAKALAKEEEARKKTEERKRLGSKTGCVHKTLELESISIISSIYESYQ